MKVKELIEELKRYPEDRIVCYLNTKDGTYHDIYEVWGERYCELEHEDSPNDYYEAPSIPEEFEEGKEKATDSKPYSMTVLALGIGYNQVGHTPDDFLKNYKAKRKKEIEDKKAMKKNKKWEKKRIKELLERGYKEDKQHLTDGSLLNGVHYIILRNRIFYKRVE